ncbi:MAG TPA: class I SAM-dependent methyltransferase [Caldimonas sp.]|nr:class I SAM-dependent methyltransferase [Caldimonas sp.]
MANRRTAIDDEVYDYVVAHGVRETTAQVGLRAATRSVPHAGMQIGPDQAQFMALLVRLIGARRAIEIGVFTGYSALAVALAMPEDGYLLACDVSEPWTSVGKPFWAEAGVAVKIDLRLGPALRTLDAEIAKGGKASFDFAFIDADKSGYDAYFERCMELLRPGGLIAIDNVLWGGAVAHPSKDPDTAALQALNDKLHADARIDLSLLPIGDGLTLARKR